MVSNNELITRSGLKPNERELPYSITTSDVESYLQKKVDLVTDMIRTQNKKNNKTIGQIDVRVYTTEAGKSFLPFVVLLPMSVLVDTKNENKDVLSMFRADDRDRSARMYDPISKLFAAYAYNSSDEKAFFADDWRRARGVTRDTSPVLKSLRTAKVISLDNGKVQQVSFMIDPIRVFHDILKMDNDKRDFKIEISGWQKIESGEFRYDVKRVINRGKKQKYSNTLANELNRKIRGRR